MAHEYLGVEFDIHCGGMDLVFPHHENEIAQARAPVTASPDFWLHNSWVTMGGEKMRVAGQRALHSGCAAKGSARRAPVLPRQRHHRSMLEFTETALQDAAKAYTGIEEFLHRVRNRVGAVPVTTWTEKFGAALDDDLGWCLALAEVHHARRRQPRPGGRRPRDRPWPKPVKSGP